MRIALLEDEAEQAARERLVLEGGGHSVHVYARGRPLLTALKRESFDLVVIDWEIPDLSGYDVLRTIRGELQSTTPVLFLTHRDNETDIVQALEAGADDFLVKPARDRELLARVQALGRRTRAEPSEVLEILPYRIDTQAGMITRDGEAVQLTRREFEVAVFFFKNIGKVLSRSHLLESVWGRGGDFTTRTVDTHVSRLRSALGLSAANGVRLTPVYGYGYRLEAVPSTASG